MNCKTCDYPLWNLTSAQCPECGKAFKPSDYEFVPNSVRFCCPHCDHPYYGTGDMGHVEPTSFACIKCGKPVHLDEMVLRPGLGVKDQHTRPQRMPWLERHDRGRIKAWFQMIRDVMVSPSRLGAAIPPDASLAQAWIYCILTISIFAFIGLMMPIGLFGILPGLLSRNTAMTLAPVSMLAHFMLTIVGFVLIVSALIGIWALLTHAVLRVSGGAAGPFRRTLHALLYGAGAGVIGCIPCFGWMVGHLWWAVNAGFVLSHTQRVHPVRAVVATLALPGLIALSAVGLFIGATFATTGTPSAASSSGLATAASRVTDLTSSLMGYAMVHNGSGPDHVMELLIASSRSFPGGGRMTGPPTPRHFIDPASRTTLADILLAGLAMDGFDKAPRNRQLKAVAAALESIPPQVIAYRLGDCIFAYPGANLTMLDQSLWVVVMLPDPQVNGPPNADDMVTIGTAAHTFSEVLYADLAAELIKQNAHRKTLGLPPLPDLKTITHDSPAVPGSTPDPADSQDDE